MEKKTLKIAGMTCAACSSRIEKVLNKQEGVIKAEVNLVMEKLDLEYDDNIIDENIIVSKIEQIGYKVINDNIDDNIRKDKEIKRMYFKVKLAILFAIPLFYIAMAPMLKLPFIDALEPMKHSILYSLIELILVLPIIIIGNNFYINGFKNLIKLSPNMDSLIAIGTSSALIYSLYNTILIINGNHMAVDNLYYESAGIIITLILIGKTLETVSKNKTSAAIKKLMELEVKNALIIKDGQELEIAIEDVKIGDILVAKPGMKIAVDGIVVEGYSSVDESMLTGESMPQEKKINDKVFAACININGNIRYQATKVGKDTLLAQIIKAVEKAQQTKAPIAKMADIVAGIFVPIVILIAIIASLAWLVSGADISFVLKIFISILVIACPCALGLATPTAIVVGTGKASEYGILFKNSEALEISHQANCIVLDKTGTITLGKPTVSDVLLLSDINEEELIKKVASIEKMSEHPLSQAIVKYSEELKIDLIKVEEFKSISGQGIEALLNDTRILIGNERLMNSYGISINFFQDKISDLSNEAKTAILIAFDNEIVAIIAVSDVIKETTKEAIVKLKEMNLKVIMMSGDNKHTANVISQKVGITKVIAEVLPQDKANEIRKLQDNNNSIIMVGDGINDAPALVQANIGMAIGNGTDIAIESADVVLIKNDLLDVVKAIDISTKTIRNIKQNLFWAFIYNIVGIPIAAGLLYLIGGPLLNPIIAALAMSLSSVSVLSNALRLRKINYN